MENSVWATVEALKVREQQQCRDVVKKGAAKDLVKGREIF